MENTTAPKTTSLPADHAIAMPAFVERSHLVVQDLPAVSAWYQRIVGLSPIEESKSGVTLGAAGRPLLTLTSDGNAAKAPRSAPGLFHHAFLVPGRKELGRWLAHAVENGVRLQGASDHLVSEAIYLADPEGNGIEIYRDRPRDEWTYQEDGTVAMKTLPLDLQALYDEAPKGAWNGLADGTTIGHIHLQVSDIPQADAFFRDALGLDLMARYPGASFFASGKYHHHVAANIWNSRGAPKRQGNMTGLADYTIRFNDAAVLAAVIRKLDALEIAVSSENGIHSLTDPWGIGLKLAA
ncbi:VOC family protein [Bradyrhizobium sp. BRP14]|nr:VOC family protein [Bradyrhizobium sp. BRP14]